MKFGSVTTATVQSIRNSTAAISTRASTLSPLDFGCNGDGRVDDTKNLQASISHCSMRGFELDGKGRTYLISDILGEIPPEFGSWREDRGLYIWKGISIRNLKIVLSANVRRFTSIINLYLPKNDAVVLRDIEINGSGKTQDAVMSSREDGGLHGIRIYGRKMCMGKWVSGRITMEGVTIDNCFSDGLAVRPIQNEELVVRHFVARNNGRNGVTCNARTGALFEDVILSGNGWRTAPGSGFHFEPDELDSGEYEWFRLRRVTAKLNKESGIKFDLRTRSASTIKLIELDDVTSISNGLASGSKSRSDFGLASVGTGNARSVLIQDSTLGTLRCTNPVEKSENPPVQNLVLKNVSMLGYFRVENRSAKRIESIDLDATYINRSLGNSSFAAVELTGAGGVTSFRLKVNELTSGGAHSIRLDGYDRATGKPYSELLQLSIKRFSGKSAEILLGGFSQIEVRNTNFGQVAIKTGDSSGNLISVKDSVFSTRSGFGFGPLSTRYKNIVFSNNNSAPPLN